MRTPTDADTDSDTDADTDSDTDADTDSDTDADTDSDTDADTGTDTGSTDTGSTDTGSTDTGAPTDTGTRDTGAAPIDLALGGTATQSSTIDGNGLGLAAAAIDGNTDGIYGNGSVSHTWGYETDGWWQVELPQDANVSQVLVYNRTDCCQTRIAQAWVHLSPGPFPHASLANTLADPDITSLQLPDAGLDLYTLDFPTSPTTRYVRVQLSDVDFLHMAEVVVIGTPTP